MSYLYVTCRKDLMSTTKFSKYLQVMDPENGEILPLSTLKKVPTLIFVHGYRGTWDAVADGYRETFEVFRGLPESFPYEQVIGFFWPGSWDAFLGYLRAEWRATEAGRMLKELCELVGPDFTLSGHSLGCRVIAEALLYGATPSHVLYLGAAVTANSYEPGDRYQDNRDIPHTILYSDRDPILKKPFRWAHFGAKALGCIGLYDNAANRESQTLRAIDVSAIVHGHSKYRSSHEYYQALKRRKQL